MSHVTPTFEEHDFRKAKASEPNKDCVRVARQDGWVEIRDDKTAFGAPDDRRLVVTAEEFDAFLAGTRTNDLTGLPLEIISRPHGTHTFRRVSRQTNIELEFTDAEVTAFLAGVRAGEFDLAAYTTA
jgi:uncharacterized protein DUF397